MTTYSIEEIKTILSTMINHDIEPEVYLEFTDNPNTYMIIGYLGHFTFQRCGIEDGSEEIYFSSLEELFASEVLDGICLSRDWNKISALWSEPDIDYLDEVIEVYRAVAEMRNERLGNRHLIYQIVKEEVDKWNPYCLLPDAPVDEFYSECEDIARRIKISYGAERIASIISRIFGNSFEPEQFTPDKCMGVAQSIYNRILQEVS